MAEYVVIDGRARKIIRKKDEYSLIKVWLDDSVYPQIYAKKEWICKGVVMGRLVEEDDEGR